LKESGKGTVLNSSWSTRQTKENSRSSSWDRACGRVRLCSAAELGYNVKTFCIQDTPRRAHSIAAQGGINAAKNYPGDGDSIWRLFYDTIKGGDFRAREANVYRLAQISNQIIDLCVAQGVPLQESMGPSGQPLLRWSPGIENLLRQRPDRAAVTSGRLSRDDATGPRGKGQDVSPREMVDLVVVNDQARESP